MTNIKTLANKLWAVLLFLIVGFPRILQMPKMVLCALIIFLALQGNTKLRFGKPTIKFALPWLTCILISIVLGIAYNNSREGILAVIKVDILNWFLYLILISVIRNENTIEYTMKAIIAGTFYISIYNIVLVFGSYVGINVSALLKLDPTAAVGIHTGFSHIVSTNLSMSIMLFPLLLFYMRIVTNDTVGKKMISLCVALCAMSMALSGRRILWIILAFNLYGFFITSGNAIKKIKYTVYVILAVAVLVFISTRLNILSLDGIIDRLISAFVTSKNVDGIGGAAYRFNQSEALIKSFLQRPVFGNGAGASAYGSTEYSYELSYHVVLLRSGIVGTMLYLYSIISIPAYGFKIRRRENRSVGNMIIFTALSVIIANATNPYFSSSFDFEIFLFLPLLFCEMAVVISAKTIADTNIFA